MRSFPIAAILALMAAQPAAAALAVGDTAPDFSTSAVHGDGIVTVELANLLQQGPVVLFFFPSAFTESSECQEFAANVEAFRAAGASVVGVSRDTVDTLVQFSKDCGAKFPLASADVRTIDGFDVNDGATFNTRTTYVVAPSGKIAFVHDEPEAGGHAKSALAFVRAMKR